MIKNEEVLRHFQIIDEFLDQHKQFWQFKAFEYTEIKWHDHAPLMSVLNTLNIESIHTLKSNADACLTKFEEIFDVAFIRKIESIFKVEHRHTIETKPESIAQLQRQQTNRAMSGVKGRKLDQIQAFSHALHRAPFHYIGNGSYLEWCAGKGHLGRYLAVNNDCKVKSLEWQEALCEAGTQLANKYSVEQTFICTDALSEQAIPFISQSHNVVALHACGDLHSALIKAFPLSDALSLSVSPCCYNRIESDNYLPLSLLGQQAHCALSKTDVSLALKSVVTAPQKIKLRQASDEQVLWRLAFDAYQKELRNGCQYLPLPSHSSVFKSSDTFFRWACDKKAMPYPSTDVIDTYVKNAELHFISVRRMELVQGLFQRIIELWLVLEKASYLYEQGLNVHVSVFCSNTVTPRNLLIQAFRR